MNAHRTTQQQMVEVRGFKWPRRATSIAMAQFLGEDVFGRWLGVAKGTAWKAADGSRAGTFDQSLVKLIPYHSFWTVCFHPVDPVVDVDIVLPVRWDRGVVEEVDLELDILRSADGSVYIRDQDTFDQVREAWAMPAEIIAQAEETFEQVRVLMEQGAEPFNEVGRMWLTQFMGDILQADEVPAEA